MKKNTPPHETLTEEEKLVAELELLGIGYLSRQADYRAAQARPPAELLADLVQQPSARVRAAVIAVLLAHPNYAGRIPAALERLRPREQLTLRLFYTAAVWLQQEHADRLRPCLAARWQWLPDIFSAEFDLPTDGSPGEKLAALGHAHRRLTQAAVNWIGTYEDVAHRLLRRWELEMQWNWSITSMRFCPKRPQPILIEMSSAPILKRPAGGQGLIESCRAEWAQYMGDEPHRKTYEEGEEGNEQRIAFGVADCEAPLRG